MESMVDVIRRIVLKCSYTRYHKNFSVMLRCNDFLYFSCVNFNFIFHQSARTTRTFHTCKKCIYEQFALEYVLFDYFTSTCHRTENPEDADYFYLPIIRDVDYRIALSKNGDRTPSVIESALLDGEKLNFVCVNI